MKISTKKALILVVGLSVIGSAVFAGGTRAGGTPASAGGKPVVSYLTWGGYSDDPAAYVNRARIAYEQEHNVIIDLQLVPYDDYPQKMSTMIVANALPHLMAVEEHRILEFGSQGILKDLRPLYAEDGIDIDDWFVAGQMASIGNRVYGVATGGAMILLYYNKGLLQKAGITPPSDDPTKPWTWDQYLDALTKLTIDRNGKHPNEAGFDVNNVVQWGTSINPFWI
jgi:multiple sugar transport system substrate-binding protein